VEGVYLGRVFPLVSGSWRGELVDPRGRVDAELFEDGGLAGADLGALAEGACGAGEGADLDAVELAPELGPGGAAGVFGDAGQEQREPAQDDVGADALFLAVVDGAQVDDLLEVSPAALKGEAGMLA
jgi:hypothetical protein